MHGRRGQRNGRQRHQQQDRIEVGLAAEAQRAVRHELLQLQEGDDATAEGDGADDGAQAKNSQLGPFTVDVSQFKSDSSRRDSMIQRQFLFRIVPR